LLEPTRIYVPEVVEMLRAELDVKALIHMTGDGLLNLSRVAAPVGFIIDFWPEPHPIFDLIRVMGRIGPEEMFRVFNMGIGFCLVLPDDSRQIDRASAIAKRHGVECYRLGYAVRDAEQRISLKPYNLVGHRGRFVPGSRFTLHASRK
jgi:phosphoribosylformylglycinamidine cyclo-ligase